MNTLTNGWQRIAAAVVSIAVGLVSVFASAPSAHAAGLAGGLPMAASKCHSGYLCVWQTTNHAGQMYPVPAGKSYTMASGKDAHSAYNNSAKAFRLYQGTNTKTAPSICVVPKQSAYSYTHIRMVVSLSSGRC